MSTNILLMCGGDGSEHEISLLSAKFIEKQLNLTKQEQDNPPPTDSDIIL